MATALAFSQMISDGFLLAIISQKVHSLISFFTSDYGLKFRTKYQKTFENQRQGLCVKVSVVECPNPTRAQIPDVELDRDENRGDVCARRWQTFLEILCMIRYILSHVYVTTSAVTTQEKDTT